MAKKEILPDSPFDISQRGATNETLPQFKGKDRQIIIQTEDNHRIYIMDGKQLGGKSSTALQEAPNRYKNTNTFEKPIKLEANVASGSEVLGVNAKAKHYDVATNTFDASYTDIKNGITLVDKNDALITQIQNTVNKNQNTLTIGVNGKETSGSLVITANSDTKKSTVTVTEPEITASGSEVATANFVIGKTGNLSDLQLTSKDNLVNAINEIVTSGSSVIHLDKASETQAGIIELATQAEVTAGTDAERAVTPKTLKTVVDTLNQEIQAVHRGKSQLAYKDYTQTDNQGDMVTGTYYKVPFNKSNIFILFDKNTGKPATSGNETANGDLKVAYYTIMFKGDEGTVSNLGNEDPRIEFEDMASRSKDNQFTGSNTFTKAVTAQAGITSNATIDISSGGTTVPNANQVKAYVESLNSQYVTALPSQEDMKPHVIYFEYKDE